MSQDIINWVLGCFGALLGFVMKSVWDAVKDLQSSDKELADKVSRIEVLVAGEYVKKEEFNNIMLRIFEKLDHIENKIDSKQDK
jgi:putative exporter of polyketide antibiotics